MKKTIKNLWKYVVGVILLIVFILLTIKLPDIDLGFKNDIIQHRSAITHSALIPFLFILFLISKRQTILRNFICSGVVIGFMVHLIFDLFPKGWNGYALIYFPFLKRLGWFGKFASPIWIIFSILFLIMLLIEISKYNIFIFLTSFISLFGSIYLYSKIEGLIIFPLAVAVTAFFISLIVMSKENTA